MTGQGTDHHTTGILVDVMYECGLGSPLTPSPSSLVFAFALPNMSCCTLTF
jgi:hypothetical protein